MYEAMKRVMIVLEFDANDNAEVSFTKELIQTKEDFEDLVMCGEFTI